VGKATFASGSTFFTAGSPGGSFTLLAATEYVLCCSACWRFGSKLNIEPALSGTLEVGAGGFAAYSDASPLVPEAVLVVGSHPCRVVVRILLGAAAAGLRCVVADMGRRGAVGACDINVCVTLDIEIGGEDSSQVTSK
jgi:hypothetical protein